MTFEKPRCKNCRYWRTRFGFMGRCGADVSNHFGKRTSRDVFCFWHVPAVLQRVVRRMPS